MTTVLLAHPSAELYGSDRMLLESARALLRRHRVVVALPTTGPLVTALESEGAEVEVVPVPVLRRDSLRPRGFARFMSSGALAVRPMIDVLRRYRVDALYVNTIVLPLWTMAGRAAGVPTLCHVHEAEFIRNSLVRSTFFAPLRCADSVVFNSHTSASTVTMPRSRVIYNGVVGPSSSTAVRESLSSPVRLVQVGRISERKGTDVAVRAAQLLTDRGLHVHLTVVGDSFAGNEAFERRVRSSAGANVTFAGHRTDVWDSLASADIALVPSRLEPFGNVAVEAMLSGRPVIASATEGLLEIVDHGRTGLLVEPGNSRDLADAVVALTSDWTAATAMTTSALSDATRRFSLERYHREVVDAVADLLDVDFAVAA
ncbi:glycosyltransferase [Rhodococcus sp. NBC_00294]|uniref:glycosyltransferase n=1 Tax=Rhodococcus sp. NBC_00294 TaxID=2976004 RepID=UPI002E2ADBF4|nr:glycosyltransferase [Rhodococcus sp. NBC_00294]